MCTCEGDKNLCVAHHHHQTRPVLSATPTRSHPPAMRALNCISLGVDIFCCSLRCFSAASCFCFCSYCSRLKSRILQAGGQQGSAGQHTGRGHGMAHSNRWELEGVGDSRCRGGAVIRKQAEWGQDCSLLQAQLEPTPSSCCCHVPAPRHAVRRHPVGCT